VVCGLLGVAVACSGTGTTAERVRTASSPGTAATSDPPARTSSTAGSPRSGPPPATLSTHPAPPTAGVGSNATGWGPTVSEWRAARHAASRMSDEELAGQVIVARYTGTRSPAALVARYHLGGVIVMGDNVVSVGQVMASNAVLQADDGRAWPLVVAVDQEGGVVARLGEPMTQFPTLMSQGAAGSRRLAHRVAAASARELRAAGFTMVFAPDADVTVGPADPTIGSRSAGSSATEVAAVVSAATAGYVAAGIVPVLKHFPGHGSVTADSHETLPVQHASLAQLRQRDFVPFARAIHAGAPAVMVGHLALEHVEPGVPADLSKADVGLLSSEFGFRGLVSTDALEMAAVTDQYGADNAAVVALRAGVDLLLMPASTDAAYHGIVDAIRAGTLSRARVENAAAKVIALMLHEARRKPVASDVIGSHGALAERLSGAAATVVAGPCRGPYVGSAVTPVGDPEAVRRFISAAQAAGLRIGGGRTVALLGYGAQGRAADVVVSLDTPYVLGYSTASVARIALFGSDPGAMRALVSILTGKIAARGRLPVAVPGVDPPSC
jgi:beta-N-acetylhexosaminidase